MLLVGPVVAAGPPAGCGQPGPGVGAGPVDPTTGVALLAVVEGQVKVRREGGVEVAAAADMALARTDTVVTSPGALVVVVLTNGYVIKLEEDQTTPVRALAHLDDPPASESVAELFERALGAEEFARLGGADRLERIAGWNARRASGETPAPVAKAEAAPVREAPTGAAAAAPVPAPIEEAADDVPVAEAKKAEERAEGSTESSSPPKPTKAGRTPGSRPRDELDTDKADESPRPSDKKKSSSSESGGATVPSSEPPGGAPTSPAPEPEKAPPAPDLADGWSFEPGDGTHVLKSRLPALLAGRRQALAECLASVGAAELRLRVAAGVVTGVALAGGKSAPGCAGGLVGKSLPEPGGDGWVVVRARR